MKDYLTATEYAKLTDSLKELVEKKREPSTSTDKAFAYGYNSCMNNMVFLSVYAHYISNYPKCNVGDLHALCLGYGTAGSVIDSLTDDDGDNNSNNDNKTYH